MRLFKLTLYFVTILCLLINCDNPTKSEEQNNDDDNNKDNVSQIEELNYDNNVSYFSLHIGTPSQSKPDLSIEGVSSSQHHLNSPSGSWSFNYRVINMGQGTTAGSSTVKVFLSSDDSYSSSDKLLAQENIGSLSVGSYYDKSIQISIPDGYSKGNYYYVIVVADANDEVNELNENNNYNSFCLHIGTPSESKADLVVENLSSPQHHVSSGDSWDISYRIQNMGQGATEGSSMAKLYLSTNKTLSDSDTFLKEVNVSSISKGDYKSLSTNIEIPSGPSNGFYYILVKANAE